MSNSVFPFLNPNDLTEFSLITGGYKRLVFNVTDDSGSAMDLSGATITWKLAPLGTSISVLTKTGASGSATGQFYVDLLGSDTSSIGGGVFLHQYTIVDTSGSPHTPSQGIILLIPGIV